MAIVRPLVEVTVADGTSDHTIDWAAIDVPGSEDVYIVFHGDHTEAMRLVNSSGVGIPIPATSGEPFTSGPYKPDNPEGFNTIERPTSTELTYSILLSEP